MLKVYSCLIADHDPAFVLFAAAMCLLAALTAFTLADHIRDRGIARRARWIILAGCVNGAGIWATHFIAMLAYQPRLPTGYSLLPTLFSILIAALMTTMGWWITLSERKLAATFGAVVITAGIGMMHFSGMSALRTTGTLTYDPVVVGVACTSAAIFAVIALNWHHRWPQRFAIGPAFALTLAICSLHFGSMAAVTIRPDATINIPIASVSKEMLVVLVSVLVAILLVAALVTALLEASIARFTNRIAHLASHDPLTGLANTSELQSALYAALARAKSYDSTVSLLCLGVDRFKAVNDVYGHAVGDRVLVEVARRLNACCGDAFIVRLGGDEFAILMQGSDQGENAHRLAEQIIESVAAAVDIDDVTIRIGISVGIALFPQDAIDGHDMRRKGDSALIRAKDLGRGIACRYAAVMDEKTLDRYKLEDALRNALPNNQLSIHYQPIVCVETGGVLGFEALLRWHHPEFGNISPAQFVPMAEADGLIIKIGAWVLDETCRQAQSWSQPLKIAVNLSAVQFTDGGLVDKVRRALADSGLDPSRLILEITEGLLIDDTQNALLVLHELKNMGVKIAMDDFGTGFSSLSYFRQFPFDKVKIDQSFVRDMAENRQSMAVVKAVIGIAKALDILVLAEGVETMEQLDILSAAGCHQVQGYLLGKPGMIAQYESLTIRRSSESHACGNCCENCLERLRPPCGIKVATIPSFQMTSHGLRTNTASIMQLRR